MKVFGMEVVESWVEDNGALCSILSDGSAEVLLLGASEPVRISRERVAEIAREVMRDAGLTR